MYFTTREKQAIQRMAVAMIAADGKVAIEEVIVNKIFNDKFGITSSDIDASSSMDLQTAISIVKNMTESERRMVCAYLGTILASDKDIDKNEMLLWSLLTSQCDFPEMSIVEAAKIMSNI